MSKAVGPAREGLFVCVYPACLNYRHQGFDEAGSCPRCGHALVPYTPLKQFSKEEIDAIRCPKRLGSSDGR